MPGVFVNWFIGLSRLEYTWHTLELWERRRFSNRQKTPPAPKRTGVFHLQGSGLQFERFEVYSFTTRLAGHPSWGRLEGVVA